MKTLILKSKRNIFNCIKKIQANVIQGLVVKLVECRYYNSSKFLSYCLKKNCKISFKHKNKINK